MYQADRRIWQRFIPLQRLSGDNHADVCRYCTCGRLRTRVTGRALIDYIGHFYQHLHIFKYSQPMICGGQNLQNNLVEQ